MLAKYFALALVAAGIASAAAAPNPATTTKCEAQAILDKCLKDLGNIVADCGATNYKCLCDGHKNMLTCYNNCPNDPQKDIEQSQVTAWCVAAGGGALSSAPLAATTATDAMPTQTGAAGTGTGTATATTSGSGGSKTSSSTGSKTPLPTQTGAGSAVRPMGFVAGALAAAAYLL